MVNKQYKSKQNADKPVCKEELHGGALDPPALGDAVEEPRSVVVHDKLEKGALGDERNIVIFKTISINFFKSYILDMQDYIGTDSSDAQFSSLFGCSSDGIVVLEEGERPPGRHLRHDQDNTMSVHEYSIRKRRKLSLILHHI